MLPDLRPPECPQATEHPSTTWVASQGYHASAVPNALLSLLPDHRQQFSSLPQKCNQATEKLLTETGGGKDTGDQEGTVGDCQGGRPVSTRGMKRRQYAVTGFASLYSMTVRDNHLFSSTLSTSNLSKLLSC